MTTATKVKLTTAQRNLVLHLQRGYRIVFGRTGSAQTTRTASVSWGEMLCRPGAESGLVVNPRVLDALVEKGLLEKVPKPPVPHPIDSLSAFMRAQDTPRVSMQLTTKGKGWRA